MDDNKHLIPSRSVPAPDDALDPGRWLLCSELAFGVFAIVASRQPRGHGAVTGCGAAFPPNFLFATDGAVVLNRVLASTVLASLNDALQ